MDNIVRFEKIRHQIFVVRRQRVMLSGALAELYGVEPRALVQAVTRNAHRFPSDFMFRLTSAEWQRLRSQNVILDSVNGNARGRHSKYMPLAFTEHGVAMLSSVLRSKRAVEVNIEIVRTFVRVRQWVIGNRELAQKLAELEKRFDGQFKIVFDALEELMTPEVHQRAAIGFSAA